MLLIAEKRSLQSYTKSINHSISVQYIIHSLHLVLPLIVCSMMRFADFLGISRILNLETKQLNLFRLQGGLFCFVLFVLSSLSLLPSSLHSSPRPQPVLYEGGEGTQSTLLSHSSFHTSQVSEFYWKVLHLQKYELWAMQSFHVLFQFLLCGH